MAQINEVIITIVTPTEKKKYPFIPGMRNMTTTVVRKSFTSKEQMMADVPELLNTLEEIWDE